MMLLCMLLQFCLLVLKLPDSMLDAKIANCIAACSDSDCKAFMQLDKMANRCLCLSAKTYCYLLKH